MDTFSSVECSMAFASIVSYHLSILGQITYSFFCPACEVNLIFEARHAVKIAKHIYGIWLEVTSS